MLAVPLTSIIQWLWQLIQAKTPKHGQQNFVVGHDLALWHEHIRTQLDV
jgi:hypothetical protein